MKYRLKKTPNSARIILITAISLIVTSCTYWILSKRNTITPCTTVVNISRDINNNKTEGSLLVKITPTESGNLLFLINGYVNSSQKIYTISRIIETGYHYDAGFYQFTILKIKNQPADNMTQSNIKSIIPIVGNKYFMFRIERLDDEIFLYTGNRAPAFICSKTE